MIGIQQFGFGERLHALTTAAGARLVLFDFLFGMNAEIILRLLRVNRFKGTADLRKKKHQTKAVKNFEAFQPHE